MKYVDKVLEKDMGFRQFSLLPELKRQYEHGGDLLIGKRKVRRPFDRKKCVHLVFRSEEAKGPLSFLLPENKKKVRDLLEVSAKKWGIWLQDRAVNSNHIHVLIYAIDKHALNGFLRSFPGSVAMAITGAKKGSKLLKRFWSRRVYSRIVGCGKELLIVKKYIYQNTLESLGIIPYQPRKKRYAARV